MTNGVPAWTGEGRLTIDSQKVTFRAVDGPRSLAVEIEQGDYGDPSRWYGDESARRPTVWSREYNGLSARVTSAVPRNEDDPAYWFSRAAEACLSLAGPPRPDFDAEDGTVLRAPGLHLIDLDDHALLVSEFFDAELWAPSPGLASIRQVSSLPPDLPRASLRDAMLYPIGCGNGDWLLVQTRGWTFSEDGKGAPEGRYWRHDATGWSREEDVRGVVAGCGPGWTLVASEGPIEEGVTGRSWKLELRGTNTMAPPVLASGHGPECPHRLDLMDIVASPTGDVVAVGTECRGGIKRQRAAAERWRLGQREHRFDVLPVPVGSWNLLVAGSPPNDVNATIEVAGETWFVHFDGRRWTASLGPGIKESGRSVGMSADDPSQVATLPRSKDPRAELARIQESFIAPSGDVWVVAAYDKPDCGACFIYRALVRIPADRRSR
jgi:hypothetical protein